MIGPVSNPISSAAGAPTAPSTAPQTEGVADEMGKKFEKMLWAEMLSHAGLEKSLTQNGGDSASAFAQYIVEAIAEDIAEKHPLGLSSLSSEAPVAQGE